MKKIFRGYIGLSMILILSFGLVACKDKKEDVATDTDGATATDAVTTEAFSEEAVTTEEAITPEDIDISLDVTALNMDIDDVAQVEAKVTPEELTDYKLLWSSSNTAVATVEDGTITAIDGGSCVITVKVMGDTDKAQISITVNPHEEETQDMANGSDDDASGSGSGSGSGSSQGTTEAATTEAATTEAATTEAATTEAATTEATTEEQQEAYYLEYANAVLDLVNDERAKVGAPALTLDSTVTAAAKIRAKECATSFSHTRPDGSSCFTALDEAGASYGACGENIAAGYWSPESVVEGWVNSPGHYSNMISTNYTRMGLGCWYDSESSYGVYWAQMFTN